VAASSLGSFSETLCHASLNRTSGSRKRWLTTGARSLVGERQASVQDSGSRLEAAVVVTYPDLSLQDGSFNVALAC
jgi:hypothetical protein